MSKIIHFAENDVVIADKIVRVCFNYSWPEEDLSIQVWLIGFEGPITYTYGDKKEYDEVVNSFQEIFYARLF